MSNGGGTERKKEPHEITAEDIYKSLNELRAQAIEIREGAIATNDKLINGPAEAQEVAKSTVEAPVNPRHFPGFRDTMRDISHVLRQVQNLQDYLLKHI